MHGCMAGFVPSAPFATQPNPTPLTTPDGTYLFSSSCACMHSDRIVRCGAVRMLAETCPRPRACMERMPACVRLAGGLQWEEFRLEGELCAGSSSATNGAGGAGGPPLWLITRTFTHVEYSVQYKVPLYYSLHGASAGCARLPAFVTINIDYCGLQRLAAQLLLPSRHAVCCVLCTRRG